MPGMETFTIREAAERCEVSYQAVRKRVDRGSVQVVHKDGVRRIPQAELERAGLWPGARMGAPAEVQRLQGENEELRHELRELRLLPQRVDAEREAREHVELALHQERAEKQTVVTEKRTVEEELREVERARIEASSQLDRVAEAGFFERRRLLREMRGRTSAAS